MPRVQSRPRHRPIRAVTVLLLTAGLMPLTQAAPSAPAAATSTADQRASSSEEPSRGATGKPALPDNVRVYSRRESLLGSHVWYRQVRSGHPVVGGWYARHFDGDGHVAKVYDGRVSAEGSIATEPRLSPEAAASNAVDSARLLAPEEDVGDPELMVLPAGGGVTETRLVWAVTSQSGRGVWMSYVDTQTGEVLRRDRVSKQAGSGAATVRGRGRVFDPNPVVALQRQGLKDRKDRTTEALVRAYVVVDLPRLRPGLGLVGRWAQIGNDHRANSPKDVYFYSRTNERFEQVVAYHGVDKAQRYFQSLGFTDVNAERQRMVTNRFRYDNSFYNPSNDNIQFGSGGVDDAEDLEIVWHEYGHAVQDDQVPGFGASAQAGAIGEGFGDYLAVTMSEPTSRRTTRTPLACVADWDAVSYDRSVPRCLRRVDRGLQLEDRNGGVHHDGQIWSRALWDIWRSVEPTSPGLTPRDMANRIIVESHFWMQPRISMPRAAKTTVEVARQLYGAAAASDVRAAFAARHLLSR